MTEAQDVDDRARSWERHRQITPQVGAVVTMGRRGGGHVGIVSGFTKNGDPIVISGNHGGRVAESVYKRSRIRAWVSPT
ncbi:CHAP domain-containing protein [Bradyrhizobium sp. th.b2]|uniref:CHAP domain-containing protein n=1 Tax=Bradyrhizobium sp. th-b2 TaxID=172088 RepID=UPI003528E7BA